MGTRLSSSNNIELSSPGIVAKGDSERLWLALYGTGAAIGSNKIYVIDPDGASRDITGTFIAHPVTFTFLANFYSSFQFTKKGGYLFIFHDVASGDAIVSSTFCSEWASRIDIPVSDMNKIRTEISRVRTTVKKGA